jgi:hypothetical protein
MAGVVQHLSTGEREREPHTSGVGSELVNQSCQFILFVSSILFLGNFQTEEG